MNEHDRERIYLQIVKHTKKSLEEIGTAAESLTPQQTDLYRTQLSALYGLLTDELARLEQEKALLWLEIKKNHEGVARAKPLSDAATDAHYDATPNGQRRIELKFMLKAMEKMISALAGRMHRLNQEFIMER